MKASRKDSRRTSLFDESMEAFYRAAELIKLDPRVRLELEEPDFEHIFYITIETRDRLVPVTKEEEARFKDLPASSRAWTWCSIRSASTTSFAAPPWS